MIGMRGASTDNVHESEDPGAAWLMDQRYAQPRANDPMAVTKKSGDEAINEFNIRMRSQPWFVDWHRQRGLDPSGNGNRKLSGREQDELEALVGQHLFPKFGGRVPDGMTVDSGGSLNTKHGWASLPTAAKIAIVAGIAVATAGVGLAVTGPTAGAQVAAGGTAAASGSAAPAAASVVGMGGATAAKGAGMAASAGMWGGGGAALPTAAAAAPAAAKTGLTWGKALGWAAPVAERAIGGYLSNRAESNANDARLQSDRENRALEESKLDPNRGYMMQARNAAGLDWMANQEFTPPALQVDSKYGAGFTAPSERSYTGSAELRAALRAARDKVLAGDGTAPITPGATPPAMLRRRPNPNDPNSWLYS